MGAGDMKFRRRLPYGTTIRRKMAHSMKSVGDYGSIPMPAGGYLGCIDGFHWMDGTIFMDKRQFRRWRRKQKRTRSGSSPLTPPQAVV